MKMVEISGINIQWPWSELLISGKKKIETRSYKLPEKFKNKPMALIETPGKRKDFKARIIGVIVFTESKEYKNKTSWLRDQKLHLVDSNDEVFKFITGKKKFGWIVGKYYLLDESLEPSQTRGIIYATSCRVPEIALNNLN